MTQRHGQAVVQSDGGTFAEEVRPMVVRYGIFQDWRANKGNPKGRFVMILFRTMHLLRQSLVTFILFLPLFVLYQHAFAQRGVMAHSGRGAHARHHPF